MPEGEYLGKIIHIVDGEAIVKPFTKKLPYRGDLALVRENQIGQVGLPFGLVKDPFVPIRLKGKIVDNLIGEKVYTVRRGNKRSKGSRGKRGRSKRKNYRK